MKTLEHKLAARLLSIVQDSSVWTSDAILHAVTHEVQQIIEDKQVSVHRRRDILLSFFHQLAAKSVRLSDVAYVLPLLEVLNEGHVFPLEHLEQLCMEGDATTVQALVKALEVSISQF